MTIELGIIISIVGVVLSVATFFFGRTSAAKDAGKKDGEIMTRLSSIDSSVTEIKSGMQNALKQIGELRDRITRLEVRVDMYHGGGAHE